MSGRDRIAELAELGVLTASLLHELRQPIFAVKGRMQLAQHTGEPLAPADLAELVQQLAHAEALLEHYAGLGRPDDSWGDLDLREAVQEAVGLVAHRARQARATIRVESNGPVPVRGRAVAMRQVALNLLANAVDAVAGADRRDVVIRTAAAGGAARLEVVDSGPGFAKEVEDHLFQPFVTTKPPGRGTGLGLYIARRLTEEAGGRIRIERAEGGGTRMVVELPAAA